MDDETQTHIPEDVANEAAKLFVESRDDDFWETDIVLSFKRKHALYALFGYAFFLGFLCGRS